MIFLDFLGMTLLFPILTPLIFNASSPLISISIGEQERALILGILIALFPLAQFFGSLYLGSFSDRFGRKPILLASLLLSTLGYGTYILSFFFSKLSLLFLGRLLTGFASGNIAVAQSVIVDISGPKDLNRNFGLMGAAIGVGFISGPFIAGTLLNTTLFPSGTCINVFLFASFLTLINAYQIMFFFKEKKNPSTGKIPLNPLHLLRSIISSIPHGSFRSMFTISFLYLMGWYFFTEFYPLWLVKKLNFEESQIGNFFVYVGLWIILTQVFILKKLSARFRPEQILRVALFLLASSLPIMLVVGSWQALLLITPIVAMIQATTMPTVLTVMSQLYPKENQGSIMGLNTALQSLAMMVPPLISGFIANWYYGLPTLIGAFLVFISWLTLMKVRSKKTFGAPM